MTVPALDAAITPQILRSDSTAVGPADTVAVVMRTILPPRGQHGESGLNFHCPCQTDDTLKIRASDDNPTTRTFVQLRRPCPRARASKAARTNASSTAR